MTHMDAELTADGAVFRVTTATADDVPRIVELLRDDPIGAQREGEDLAPYLRAFAAIDRDPAHTLVAVRDGQDRVVASLQLTLLPGLSRGGATRMQVEGVRVASSLRGSGLGTALMEWVVTHAQRMGADLVQLTTDQERLEAQAFYQRIGFTPSHLGMKLSLRQRVWGAAPVAECGRSLYSLTMNRSSTSSS